MIHTAEPRATLSIGEIIAYVATSLSVAAALIFRQKPQTVVE